MEPNGSKYKENNVGARIEPCGTPQERCAVEEVYFPIQTENFLLVKKDWNQFRTVPWKPKRFSRREIRIEWSTMSNAELRSKRTRATALPLSVASIMSLITFSKADSVLYSFLNPDWKVSYNELESRKECSWVNTTFSKIFEIKGRLEIGLKLPKSDTSRFGFFKRGVTEACFRQSGTVPVLRHILIKNTRSGPIVSTICLKKCDGILSYGQKVGFKWSIISLQVWREMKLNMFQVEEHLVISGKIWRAIYIEVYFLPQYLRCLIQQKTVGNYSLRSQMYYNLNVPSARTNLGTEAFKYAAPSDWNFLQMNSRLNQLVPFRYFKTVLCGLEKDLEICKCF